MRLPLELSRLICRLLAGMLLMAQFTIAAHACPRLHAAAGFAAGFAAGLAVGASAEAMAMPQGGADAPPPCHGPQHPMSSVCAEHCKYGQQSSDTPAAPTLSDPGAACWYRLPLPETPTLSDGRTTLGADAPPAAPPPPHAVLHCVRRN